MNETFATYFSAVLGTLSMYSSNMTLRQGTKQYRISLTCPYLDALASYTLDNLQPRISPRLLRAVSCTSFCHSPTKLLAILDQVDKASWIRHAGRSVLVTRACFERLVVDMGWSRSKESQSDLDALPTSSFIMEAKRHHERTMQTKYTCNSVIRYSL
jgi:hypothetical protein